MRGDAPADVVARYVTEAPKPPQPARTPAEVHPFRVASP